MDWAKTTAIRDEKHLSFYLYQRFDGICSLLLCVVWCTWRLYSISQEIYAHGFCFAVLCCGYTLTGFPYPSGLLHWHCGNLTIAPVPAKQPWWIWINTSCEFIMNDCITTTKQSTTKPCAYFLGYTVWYNHCIHVFNLDAFNCRCV